MTQPAVPREAPASGVYLAVFNGHARAFLIAFALGFAVSKGLGFLPGYALDDYVAQRPTNTGLTDLFLSQGRFTFVLVYKAIGYAHLQLQDFAQAGLIALAIFSALFYLQALRFRSEESGSIWIAVGLLLGAYPYLTEYVTFRQAILPMAIAMALSWTAIVSYARWRNGKRTGWLATALAAATLAVGTNQLMLALISIAVLYGEMRTAIETDRMRTRNAILTAVLKAALATTVVLLLYCAAAWGSMQWAGHGTVASRATLLPLDSAPQRIAEVAKLIALLGLGDELSASRLSKLGVWAALLVVLGSAAVRKPRLAVVAILFLCISLTLAILPIVLSAQWWPVPRTLIAIPLAITGTIMMSAPAAPRAAQLTAAAGLVFSAVVMSAHSSSILTDQQRLNRWDAARAREIAEQATREFPGTRKLALSGTTWGYPIAPEIAQGDMNVSALNVDWAVDPLFDEATGMDMHVRITNEFVQACAARPRFPEPGSLFKNNDEAIVCL